MGSEGQGLDRLRFHKRLNGEGHSGKGLVVDLMLMLFIATAAVLMMAACVPTRATDAPTVVVVVTTSTREMPTATRLPDPTATPAPTDTPLVPTIVSTVVSTETPLPTDTSVPPTDTPVPPTDTPPPRTDTPVPPTDTLPPPTDTLVPPTFTSAPPTRTPMPPTPTVPPPPQFPWRGQVVGTFANCALTRVMGLTLDRNGGIAGDIWIHFWADGWDGAWARSTWGVNEGYPGLDDSSNWDGVLATYAKDGTWYVCVVPGEGSWDCISTRVTAQTVAGPCAPDSGGVQIVRIVFQQN